MSINTQQAYRTIGSVVEEDCNTVLFPKIQNSVVVAELIEKTRWWAAENHTLTQLIYSYIRQYSAQIIQTEGANNIVDEIVHQKIIKNWRTNEAANLLCSIEETLSKFKSQDTLLILYLQILWRGGIAASQKSQLRTEQIILIRSGLVTLNQGQLQLGNRIYASVFNMEWIEQQLPGLTTRTVNIPAHISNDMSIATCHQSGGSPKGFRIASTLIASKVGKHLPTAALASGSTVLLGFVAAAYIKAPNNSGIAAQPLLQNTSQVQNTPQKNISVNSQPDSVNRTTPSKDPKTLFDQGLVHATNGRWLPMLQNFCSIPTTSAYFAIAKNQVEHWTTLYPQNIQQANNTFLTTRNTSCELIENALQSVK